MTNGIEPQGADVDTQEQPLLVRTFFGPTVGWKNVPDTETGTNVNGPDGGASTDNAVVRWDGVTGNKVQDSGVIIDDFNHIRSPGAVIVEGGLQYTKAITLSSGFDLNTLTDAGFYDGNSFINGPGVGGEWYYIEVQRHITDNGFVLQRATRLDAPTYAFYIRNQTNFTWSAWQQIPVGSIAGGDVMGPVGATDNALARYDGTTGKLLQNSNAILTDSGLLILTGGVVAVTFETRTAAAAANLAGYPMAGQLRTQAFAIPLDGGGGIYERIPNAAVGSGSGYFTSADGAAFRLVGPEINILQFGAQHDPVPDGSPGTIVSTQAVSEAIAFCNEADASGHTINKLVMGRGEIYTLTAAPPIVTRPLEISGKIGQRVSPSIINKRYVEASPTRGIFSFGRWMPIIRDLAIIAFQGAGSGGTAIDMVLPAGVASAGNCLIENCRISCGNTVNHSLLMDGRALVPGGIRNIFITNCQFFGALGFSVEMLDARNVFMTGVTIDSIMPDGSTGGGGLNLNGNGPSVNLGTGLPNPGPVGSNNFIFQGLMATSTIAHSTGVLIYGGTGNLTMDDTFDVQIHGVINGIVTSNTANVINGRIIGRIYGTDGFGAAAINGVTNPATWGHPSNKTYI